ncbi:MAG: tetratricopeptide repeat protein [Alphaproteobacteria bacterium]|nr:tetratricopeptide repeat protein [Alphaproteobacteria bacterium]
MIAVLILIFAGVALVAASFVVLPLLRAKNGAPGKSWLAAGGGLGVMAAGLGIYAVLGQPTIALDTLTGPGTSNYPALIATLAKQMPNRPNDIQGWTLLGRGYLALGVPVQAAKALQRAVQVATAEQGAAPPELLSAYGEALSEQAGQVTKEAEAVFQQALAADPSDLTARFYMGFAFVARGDRAGALNIWEGLLADTPPDVAWRGTLVDAMAGLRSLEGGAAPNPAAMVAQLATRLETNPNDLPGWLRLIRAYSVLGDKQKATEALAKARGVFANQGDAEAQLAEAARENALN